MTVYFVSRHKGAGKWARKNGIEATHVAHLDPEDIGRGDTVLGTLPVSVAADVCMRGARYFHLSMNLPTHERGRELSAEEMTQYGASLEEYSVKRGRHDKE